MNILKVILPLCLLLPSSVIISQKAEAQIQCTEYANGTRCERPPAQLEAACIATARFSACQNYHKMWCQLGPQMLSAAMSRQACNLFNLSRSNPGYYQQLMTANKFCTSGNQQACNWMNQQRLP
jgi:hypothetical protein